MQQKILIIYLLNPLTRTILSFLWRPRCARSELPRPGANISKYRTRTQSVEVKKIMTIIIITLNYKKLLFVIIIVIIILTSY